MPLNYRAKYTFVGFNIRFIIASTKMHLMYTVDANGSRCVSLSAAFRFRPRVKLIPIVRRLYTLKVSFAATKSFR